MQIDLYEDEAGFLHLTDGRRVWIWTEAPGDGDFDGDALVMSEGGDGDWLDSLGPLDVEDRPAPADDIAGLTLVASWTPERGRFLPDGATYADMADGTPSAEYLARSRDSLEAIASAAWALLHRIEHMTLDEFALGEVRVELLALAVALGAEQ